MKAVRRANDTERRASDTDLGQQGDSVSVATTILTWDVDNKPGLDTRTLGAPHPLCISVLNRKHFCSKLSAIV